MTNHHHSLGPRTLVFDADWPASKRRHAGDVEASGGNLGDGHQFDLAVVDSEIAFDRPEGTEADNGTDGVLPSFDVTWGNAKGRLRSSVQHHQRHHSIS